MLRGFTCKLCTSFSFGHLNWTHESFGSIVCEGEVLSGQGVPGFAHMSTGPTACRLPFLVL